MSGAVKRSLATFLVVALSGATILDAGAANGGGSILGKITFDGGPLNASCSLRVLSADEAVTATTILDDNGTYKIPGLPPGGYKLEVLDPKGRLLWRGDIVVESGANTLNVDIPPYPRSRARAATAAGSQAPAGGNKKWWWIGGAIGAGIAVGAGSGGGSSSDGGNASSCDQDASPSVPGCQ